MSFILGEIGEARDGTAAFLGAATIACKCAYDEYDKTQDCSSLVKALQIALCAIESVIRHGVPEEMSKYIEECEQNDKAFYYPQMYVWKTSTDTMKE